ncbi:MAG: hypothetical protein NWS32_06580 [Candidatus Nanopelagicales bacterium]|jgi:hypothetical protein|nr:hypothetical protein [Candidatus Nanopelagicales bacterium]
MRPPGWPERVGDPDGEEFSATAATWLWEVSSLERSPDDVWARYPRSLAFRVACDVDSRLEGARVAYSHARAALHDASVPVDEVLSALEREGAALQRLQREVGLVQEALGGRRWGARL